MLEMVELAAVAVAEMLHKAVLLELVVHLLAILAVTVQVRFLLIKAVQGEQTQAAAVVQQIVHLMRAVLAVQV
jgi:hypothetical protein